MRLIGLVLAASLSAPGLEAAEKPMPMDLLDRVKYKGVLISPSGRHLAVNQMEGDDNWLTIYNWPEKTIASSFNIGDEKEFADVIWVSDTHVVVSLARKMFRDIKGRTGELNSIRITEGDTKIRNLGYGTILHTLPDDPDHVLISLSPDQFNEVYRLNVVNANTRRIVRGPVPYGAFVTTGEGEVLFAFGDSPDNEREVYARGKRGWDLVESFHIDERGWVPFAEGPIENTVLTWDSRGSESGTTGLGLYDYVKDEHRLIFGLEQVDLSTVYRDFNDRVYAVRSDHHFPRVHYLSQKHPLARIRAELEKLYPEDFVTLTSSTRDNTKAVAFVSGDRNPGQYILIDLQNQKVELIFALKPNLEKESLAEMSPVEVTARDGATVYGYVTSRADTPKPGPMIVYLHGGPHGVRDLWGFNPDVQLMASHGAHVMQVNYRGSGGYGIEYQSSGYGEWGGLNAG